MCTKDKNTDKVGNDTIHSVSNLLPCPFCNAIPSVHKRQNGYWEVRCLNDENCGVIVMTDEKISKKLAIKTWNSRAM